MGAAAGAWLPSRPGSEPEPWRLALEAAASYFLGYRDRAKTQAEALPETDQLVEFKKALLPLCDREATPALPYCLHAAMRAEACLSSEDLGIIEAASLTSTFVDAAILDAAKAFLTKDEHKHGEGCVDWYRRCIIRSKCILKDEDLGKDDKGEDTLARQRERQSLEISGWKDKRAFVEVLRRVSAYVPEDVTAALADLRRGVDDNRHGQSPRQFRNVFEHSIPAEDDLEAAMNCLSTRRLWAPKATGRGQRFLGAKLPRAFLAALGKNTGFPGLANSDKMYGDLVRSLLECIE